MNNIEFQKAYQEQNRRDQITYSTLATVLSVILNLFCSVMDYFVYHDKWWLFFKARIFSVFLVVFTWAWFQSPMGRKHHRIFGVMWYASPLAIILWMIYVAQDPYSPYYAGLNIILLAVGLLSPWTYIQNFISAKFDLERPLAQSALLCSSIFSLPLPSPLRSLIDHESAAPTLAAIASRSLFSTAPDRMHSANPLLRLPQLIEELLYYNRKLRKRTPALRELSRLAVCLEDFRGAPIPDELFFLYYLRRPFFWTYRYLRESYRGPAKMTEPKI